MVPCSQKFWVPPTAYFFDNFENGVNGWTTGGTQNFWAQVTNESYSPTHSWHESPSGVYPNNMNSWLKSPNIVLTGKTNISVSGWFTHALESGYDYAYLEYSLDGGTTWNPSYLARFNGVSQSWAQTAVASPMLDNQANVALRLRVTSDSGVVADGIYMDDFAVNYTPITCEPPTPTAVRAPQITSESSKPLAELTSRTIALKLKMPSGGMTTPSSASVVESAGIDPGVGPPTSAWCARLAAKPIRPGANAGVTTVMSGRCVPPAYGSLRIHERPGACSRPATSATAAGIAPRWTGMCSACMSIDPSGMKSAVEQSRRSLMLAECAAWMSTAPISSHAARSAPLTTWRVTGSSVLTRGV